VRGVSRWRSGILLGAIVLERFIPALHGFSNAVFLETFEKGLKTGLVNAQRAQLGAGPDTLSETCLWRIPPSGRHW
jgi:hypothetical protein